MEEAIAALRALMAERDRQQQEIEARQQEMETVMDRLTALLLRAEQAEQGWETERMRLAGCLTAAEGYWKEGDGIHPDYYSESLRVVAKLYAERDDLKAALRLTQRHDEHRWNCRVPDCRTCVDLSNRVALARAPFAAGWDLEPYD